MVCRDWFILPPAFASTFSKELEVNLGIHVDFCFVLTQAACIPSQCTRHRERWSWTWRWSATPTWTWTASRSPSTITWTWTASRSPSTRTQHSSVSENFKKFQYILGIEWRKRSIFCSDESKGVISVKKSIGVISGKKSVEVISVKKKYRSKVS